MSMPIAGRFVLPDVVATHFLLKEGDKVADFGAGSGFFLAPLSKAVGPTGRVYACEIQRPLVEKIGDLTRVQGLQNVDPIWCDLEEVGGVKIQESSLDAGILVNTLFQIEDKETTIKELRRVLRTGGLLYVIDWSESFGGLGPQAGDVVSPTAAKDLFESNGFHFEREYDAGDHHYGHSYRKV